MKKNEKIVPCCAMCEKASPDEEGFMICKKKGKVLNEQKCFRFRFDPLKYKPQRLPPLVPLSLDNDLTE